MIIKIEQDNGMWVLTLSEEGQAVKYKSLYKLASALLKWARGQGI